MITYDDWSQLITINYKSGAGGDFLSIILDKNFNNNVRHAKTSNYMYSYKNCPFHFYVKQLNSFNFLRNNNNLLFGPPQIMCNSNRDIVIKIYKTYVDLESPLEEYLKQYC